MSMTLYGIPNCNSVKKATDWLTQNKVPYQFHDFKKMGIAKEKLTAWSAKAGWEKLVNKKGTTWRGLPRELQAEVTNERVAIDLMMDKTSVIKRPVIEFGDQLVVGFDEHLYEETFR